MPRFLVTGTDTGCGKTEVSLGLTLALRRRGFRVQAMKPVASGGEYGVQGLRQADALRLRAQASRVCDYDWVNPYVFEPAIAPHLAAARAGREIAFEPIRAAATRLAEGADWLVVEGVGGWRVPLGPDWEVADLARRLDLAVVLVVGLRLGCLNHSLLTVESIQASGSRLVGWVANAIDPEMEALEENLADLNARIPAPRLGLVPWMTDPDPPRLADCLELDPLIAALRGAEGLQR